MSHLSNKRTAVHWWLSLCLLHYSGITDQLLPCSGVRTLICSEETKHPKFAFCSTYLEICWNTFPCENDVLFSTWHRHTQKKIWVLLSGVEPKTFRLLHVVRMFNGFSSHESPVAQWQSIQTSNWKVLGSTHDRSTQIFFRVCLCHLLNHMYHSHWFTRLDIFPSHSFPIFLVFDIIIFYK